MAIIVSLAERFYGELWNRWNDAVAEDVLSRGFAFRGPLGQETTGPQSGASTAATFGRARTDPAAAGMMQR